MLLMRSALITKGFLRRIKVIYQLTLQVFDMKKGILFYFYYLLALIVILVNSAYLIIDNYFINIESVPVGEYQYSKFSPNEAIELKVYFVELPVGNSIRITETKDNNTRNIFWQTDTEKVKIKWKNNSTVVINGIDLNLKDGEYFDCRSISSIFNDGLMGR